MKDGIYINKNDDDVHDVNVLTSSKKEDEVTKYDNITNTLLTYFIKEFPEGKCRNIFFVGEPGKKYHIISYICDLKEKFTDNIGKEVVKLCTMNPKKNENINFIEAIIRILYFNCCSEVEVISDVEHETLEKIYLVTHVYYAMNSIENRVGIKRLFCSISEDFEYYVAHVIKKYLEYYKDSKKKLSIEDIYDQLLSNPYPGMKVLRLDAKENK